MENNKLSVTSQELTVNQFQKLELTNKTSETFLTHLNKTCNLAPVKFLSVPKQRIDEIEYDLFNEALSAILTKQSNFLGIKGLIDIPTLEDLIKMILTCFKHLSLVEINKAFDLERYSQYEYKTEHFQLFNADYVSEIFKKFENWKNNNIKKNKKLFEKKIEASKPSQEETNKIIQNAIIECYLYVEKHNKLPNNKLYLYYELYKKNQLPKHDLAFKEKVKKAVFKKLYKSKGNNTDSLKLLKRNAKVKLLLSKGMSPDKVAEIVSKEEKYCIEMENYSIKKKIDQVLKKKQDIQSLCREYILFQYFKNQIKNSQ
ncbi:hypothetical protein [Wenyingzhuangia sp. 2_MG-2023]|uniref:hypothetical protein n=1 Tax=Wenyingzhuangia sp. 2_MG-2023 TaxID=3062639 RepID=UPI0026E2D495|nr:hypothetical protein [Wenyingzhuangia sp. 2_MG-2023]MDO6737128.1 hypothetical protein [Wenyingzhuangia sp. 2_MG-2023]